MTAADWLRRQRTATRGPSAASLLRFAETAAAVERIDRTLGVAEAPAAATAAEEATEAYYAAVRAPWVPDDTAPMLTHVQTKRLDSAFDRRPDCRVCAIRYSKCYCPEGA